jgi:CheY-like chemotaxis protein
MFDDTNVLVVEDESLIADDLADWVKAAGGRVIGPARTVARALELIETTSVDAAILDAHLADRDVTPVARLLIARNVPLIFYSGLGLPEELATLHPEISADPEANAHGAGRQAASGAHQGTDGISPHPHRRHRISHHPDIRRPRLAHGPVRLFRRNAGRHTHPGYRGRRR